MLYIAGLLGVLLLVRLAAWLVVELAQRRGLVVQIAMPKAVQWIAGIELAFLFWFFIESEGNVPLWLFIGSMALAFTAFGFEWFVRSSQRDELKGTPLRIIDHRGKIIRFTKSKFTNDVLPEIFKSARNDPQRLYETIVQAMGDGLADQCIRAAQRLRLLDEDTERSTVLLADVYAANRDWQAMRRVLENYLDNVGESALVLFRLAWVHHQMVDFQKFEEYLWRGFDLDPNHNEGYKLLNQHYFEGSPGGYDPDASFHRLAAHPASWWARILLADHFLREGDTEKGIEWIEAAHPNCVDVPEAIYQLSELLAVNRLDQRLVDYTAPVFILDLHGPETGINLALAYLRLGRKEDGLKIIEILRRQDWGELETQIASVERRLNELP